LRCRLQFVLAGDGPTLVEGNSEVRLHACRTLRNHLSRRRARFLPGRALVVA
jgi:hypothetical protein